MPVEKLSLPQGGIDEWQLTNQGDRESGKVVWQGFASGLIQNNAFIKDEGKIREAANLIFEEFDQRAKEYTRK